MKIFEILFFSALFAACLTLLYFLLKAERKSRQLKDSNCNLNEKIEDNVRHGLPLIDVERVLIWKAITCPQFKDKMRDPKTPRRIRDIYKELKEKIKNGIKR